MQSLHAWRASIRNLDDDTKARLRLRAARNQRSFHMEEEARTVLRQALSEADTEARTLPDAIQRRFAPLGGVELEVPARGAIRVPPRPAK